MLLSLKTQCTSKRADSFKHNISAKNIKKQYTYKA